MCLFQGHNDVISKAGIEPTNIQSLLRRIYQLSYAADLDRNNETVQKNA